MAIKFVALRYITHFIVYDKIIMSLHWTVRYADVMRDVTLSLTNIWRVQHTVYSQFTIQSSYSGQWELSEISNVVRRSSFGERNDVGEFDVLLNVHTCTSLESEWTSERKRDEVHVNTSPTCNWSVYVYVYVCVYVYVYVYVYPCTY